MTKTGTLQVLFMIFMMVLVVYTMNDPTPTNMMMMFSLGYVAMILASNMTIAELEVLYEEEQEF